MLVRVFMRRRIEVMTNRTANELTSLSVMCFPKGKSLNKITQETLDEVFSNINSYVRKSKGDKTPYDLVRAKFGKPFLDAINIQRIDNKKVKLTQLI